MASLADKIVLVTGGGQGLGAAVCRSLASAGAIVLAGDVREDRAETVARSIRESGGRAEAMRLDVADDASAEAAFEYIKLRFGRLDVLVNNAGIDRTAPVEAMTMDDWDRILTVNLRGPFLMSKLALELMESARTGHIVNVVSTASKRAWANASAYHASKWGLLGLSHALHVEARKHRVKVTAVVAGGMRTPFLLDRFPDLDPALLQAPENVAETVRFVLSQPDETVVPEVMVIPMNETSWP